MRKQPAVNKRSTVQKCTDDNDCYIAAELESKVINADGYIFYIGDGKEYGGYINGALEPGVSYSAEIAMIILLPKASSKKQHFTQLKNVGVHNHSFIVTL